MLCIGAKWAGAAGPLLKTLLVACYRQAIHPAPSRRRAVQADLAARLQQQRQQAAHDQQQREQLKQQRSTQGACDRSSDDDSAESPQKQNEADAMWDDPVPSQLQPFTPQPAAPAPAAMTMADMKTEIATALRRSQGSALARSLSLQTCLQTFDDIKIALFSCTVTYTLRCLLGPCRSQRTPARNKQQRQVRRSTAGHGRYDSPLTVGSSTRQPSSSVRLPSRTRPAMNAGTPGPVMSISAALKMFQVCFVNYELLRLHSPCACSITLIAMALHAGSKRAQC